MVVNRSWRHLVPIALVTAFVVACSEATRNAVEPDRAFPAAPASALLTPFNDEGSCLAADAFKSGATSGMGDSSDTGGSKLNCTSNDIRIARADVNSYSLDGFTFIPFTGQPVACNAGQTIFVDVDALLKETATSERTDVGIWIATDGGNARTGTCNHYNLNVLNPAVPGVSDTDGDSCGDMNNADSTKVRLGVLELTCNASGTTDSLHVGSCLAWTQPGGDQVCPVGGSQAPQAYRFGTVPDNKSKCNCDGFNFPIVVNRTAKLEVRKACVPTGDAGKFNLLIDGNVETADASCGGTTGEVVLSAGTNANPGVSHSFDETAGTGTSLGKYSSVRACVNRVGGAVRLASGAGTGGSVTLNPNDDVICTITNTRLPGKLELVKALSPTNDPGVFNLSVKSGSSGGTQVASAANVGNGGSTGAGGTSLAPGGYHLSETQGTNTLLSNYTVTGPSCVVRNTANAVTVAAGVVQLDSNDDIVCTITNTRNTGKIELRKALVPTNDPGLFNLFIKVGSAAGSTAASASDVGNNGTTGASGTTLNTGTYNLSETAGTGTDLANYQVSAAVCVNRVGGSSVTVTGGNVELLNGADIVCTITNTRNPGKLELRKALVPSGDPGLFNLFIKDGVPATVASATDVGHNGTTGASGTSLPPGTYNLSETQGTGTLLSNYTQSAPVCVNRVGGSSVTVTSGNVVLQSNADVVCTITNTRNTGKIELKKALVPSSDPGLFNLFIKVGSAAGSNAATAANVGHDGTTGASGTTLNTGTYNLSETQGTGTLLSNYTASAAVCVNRVGGGSVTVTAGNVDLLNNADIVCTITNTRNTGKIELKKALAPTNDPGLFNLFIKVGSSIGSNAATASNVGHNGTTGASGTTLITGTYNLSETAGSGTSLADYSVSAPVCVNRVGGGSVTVTAGNVELLNAADIVCTITNTRSPGRLELRKALVPSGDPGLFNLFIKDAVPATVASATDVGHNGTTGASGTLLPPGIYNLSETQGAGTLLSNYTQSAPVCVNRVGGGSVTVTAGNVTLASNADVVCTITNTRNTGKIELKKALVPSSDPGLFNLFIKVGSAAGSNAATAANVGHDGTTGASGTTLNTGTYNLSETQGTGTLLSNYTASAAVCVNRVGGSSVTVTAGNVDLLNNADIVCTITNTRNTGKLELRKATVPTTDPGLFNLAIKAGSSAGSVVASASDVGHNGTTNAAGTTLNTGDYHLSETAGTGNSLDRYVASAPVCVNRVGGSSVTVTSGVVALGTNADVVCTITNSRKAVLIVDKVVTGGGAQVFDFSQTGISNFQLADATTPKKTIDILPGNVTVCELGLAVAWDVTATVNGAPVVLTINGTTGDACREIALNYGDSTTIVFTNTPPPGGGTRTIGYWKNHASCSRGADGDGKQYVKAIERGQPEATLDYYLGSGSSIYPIGSITLLTCEEAVELLSKNASNGGKRAGDPIFSMVAQLLAAKLNVAAGAGVCAALNQALIDAQALLVEVSFNGTNNWPKKGAQALTADQTSRANALNAILTSYNEGTLGGGCPTHI